LGAGAVDANYQPNTPNNTKFIADNVTTSPLDWLADKNDNLWGNGQLPIFDFGIAAAADGAVQGQWANSGQYFQSTKWVMAQNNPCSSGFRVPTQDEWERIGAYDCNPNLAGGTFSTSANGANGTSPIENPNLTWVPVVCGATSGNCKADETWGTSARSGYAVYTTADWNDTKTSYQNDLTNPLAKEPLLFLPAAGYRNYSGSQSNVGYSGYYWSSTVNGTYSRYLDFGSTYVYPLDGNYRANGFSVRCVAE
jgi:hypothetical protein